MFIEKNLGYDYDLLNKLNYFSIDMVGWGCLISHLLKEFKSCGNIRFQVILRASYNKE